MFKSKSVAEHLFRGAIGLGAFAASTLLAASHPWLAILPLPLALLALRGCPLCWTIGLAQTVIAKLRGRPTDGYCADGSCALDASSRPSLRPSPRPSPRQRPAAASQASGEA
jgi:hypothetical protein